MGGAAQLVKHILISAVKLFVIILNVFLYLYMAVALVAWAKPAERTKVCTGIDVATSSQFAPADIKAYLAKRGLNPTGRTLAEADCRRIEDELVKSPLIKSAECNTCPESGRIAIRIVEKRPVVHVIANSGDDYYVDQDAEIMPREQAPARVIVATGTITRHYARTKLYRAVREIMSEPDYERQTVQLNVLSDGTLEMTPRVGRHTVYLGRPERIADKYRRLFQFYRYGLSRVGWTRYSRINVEFDGQIICKP